MGEFTIGKLARHTGYAVQTLRYYEEIGLMPSPPRTEGGQRRYGETHLRLLSFVRNARDLGFDIPAIRALLKLSQNPEGPCANADAIARDHLASIDNKIMRLQALRDEIKGMLKDCASESIAGCRIIERLGDKLEEPTRYQAAANA